MPRWILVASLTALEGCRHPIALSLIVLYAWALRADWPLSRERCSLHHLFHEVAGRFAPACRGAHCQDLEMFVITKADAAEIAPSSVKREGLSAGIEVLRRFPGIIDNSKARGCARTVAGMDSAAGETEHRDAATFPKGA